PIYIGNLVARAHLAARAGRPDTALELLIHAVAAEPTVPWLSGGAMSTPAGRAGLAPWRVGALLTLLTRKLDAPVDADRAKGMASLLDLARETADANPADIELAVKLSGFARAAGAGALGAAWCERAERLTPGPVGSVMLGLALRDADRPAEMEAAWTRAIAADPDNLDVYVDLATVLAAQGRKRDGEAWLARALARDPRHDRSTALRHAFDFVASDDVGHLVRLVDEAREGGYADRVSPELMLACDKRTWLNRVPMPSEATSTMANTIHARRAGGEKIEVQRTAVTAIEPASAVAATRAVLPGLQMQVLRCPLPDARVPLAPVTYKIWNYGGSTIAEPVVPAASPASVELLHEVANLPWATPLAGYEGAARFAGTPLEDLLGLLCHMPAPPVNDRWEMLGERTPTYWPRLAQVWVCLGILHHRPDEPWATSARRRVLVDLVNGVEDWTTDAAMFTLVTAAWLDPACRADVAGVVRSRFDSARGTAHRRVMTIAPSIGELVLITPGLGRADRGRARRMIRRTTHPAGNRAVALWHELQFRLGR
ncbi:MAG TPA: tetratricopeptide repeat protein, partial [Micromonosporaceae bacterium]|nr:tetratricopeptide repeat protein [Micromonosporaceae bacterium]